jgi:hypothetical protein
MNWRFCPNCETQLDDATGICPACRWDPLDAPPPAAAAPDVSLMERYRGTQYDSQLAIAQQLVQRRHAGPTTTARLFLLAGVLALVGIYGGIVAWGAMKDGMGSTPVPAQVGATR